MWIIDCARPCIRNKIVQCHSRRYTKLINTSGQSELGIQQHCGKVKQHPFVHRFKWAETAKPSWKACSRLPVKHLNSLMKLIWHNRSWSNNVSLVWVTASKQPYKRQWKGLDEVQLSQEWSTTPACLWQEWQTLWTFIAAGWSSHLTLAGWEKSQQLLSQPKIHIRKIIRHFHTSQKNSRMLVYLDL